MLYNKNKMKNEFMIIVIQQIPDSFWTNLGIGILSGVIASILLFLISKFYHPNNIKNIKNNLELAERYIWQIDAMVYFPDDYDRIIHAFEKLHDCLFQIYLCMAPSICLCKRKNKKIIYTLICDMMRCCEVSMLVTEGYSGDEEKEARIRNIIRHLRFQNERDTYSALQREHALIVALLQYPLHKAFEEADRHFPQINYEKLIDINSFKQSIFFSEIREKGISKDEYMKIIEEYKKWRENR